jgi:hypothetical protein
MPNRPQSKGRCAYCGQETTKSGMTKHLPACARRLVAIAQADGQKSTRETLFHLRVQDAGSSDFWLDLEMRGGAKLADLDHYLRAIWLECCGHLSQFSMGKGWSEEISQNLKTKAVFSPGVQLTHIYDFGTTSETLIKVVGAREGKPTTKHPIALMARNLMPEAKCIKCDQPAAWFCMECLIEDDVWGTLCDQHARQHPHGNYEKPIPLVNSPRLGMCGYTGPAEPPY